MKFYTDTSIKPMTTGQAVETGACLASAAAPEEKAPEPGPAAEKEEPAASEEKAPEPGPAAP